MASRKTSSNQVLAAAALGAIKLMQDPKVQAQVAQGASRIAAKLKQRREQQAQPTAAAPSAEAKHKAPPLKDKVSAKFGNKKFERRVENLSENVDLLRGAVGGAEAEAALGEVDDVVAKLRVAVSMAENLPIGKRQKAHWEIDSVLDDLERAVFASVMA